MGDLAAAVWWSQLTQAKSASVVCVGTIASAALTQQQTPTFLRQSASVRVSIG
jgi:hypothetical protein